MASLSDNDGGGFNRPRRPNPDTISYLKSLPLDAASAAGEISEFRQNQTTNEFPPALAAALSALDEIRQEVASLAGDERGAEVLEVLIRITAPCSVTASFEWLTACRGYVPHLAMHRYGSHVLQTILEQVFMTATNASMKEEDEQDLALHPDSPFAGNDESGEEATPKTVGDLWNLLEELQQELLPSALQLTRHLCATHVLRSLFLILGGVDMLHPHQQNKQRSSSSWHARRGKYKPKKHGENDGSGHEKINMTRASFCYIDSVRQSVAQQQRLALDKWADAIAPAEQTPTPGSLQQLACDSSGGPLLIALLRALTYRDSSDRSKVLPDMAPAMSLNRLPKEPIFEPGSKACVLAERILCWNDNAAEQNDKQQSQHAGDVIYGLAGETRGSHVLDTILRLCHDKLHQTIVETGQFLESLSEYVEHGVSNFVVQTIFATARSKDMVEKLVQSSLALITSGLIVESSQRRRGILWRLSEMAVEHDQKGSQADILQSLQSWCSLKQVAGKLLDAKRDHNDNDRLILNVEGARSLHYILQFECKGLQDVVASVLALPGDDLEALARDGLGSRCVWDAIIVVGENVNGSKHRESVAKARVKLLHKLQGRWVALATDRVGRHVVQNLFRTLPHTKQREELVQELVQGRSRLQGNSMGRFIITECAVDVYKHQGSAEWTKQIDRRLGQRDWLTGISSERAITSSSRILEGKNTAAKLDTKPRSKNKSSSPPNAPSKRSKTNMTVDSIFDALTIPGK